SSDAAASGRAEGAKRVSEHTWTVTVLPTCQPSTGVGIRYRMPGWLPVAGDDVWIRNDLGRHAYRIDGAALRLADAVGFRDAAGDEVCSVGLLVDRLRTAMEIQGPDGQRLATVTKTPISPLRDRFVVTVGDGPAQKVEGNVLGHEYRIGTAAR